MCGHKYDKKMEEKEKKLGKIQNYPMVRNPDKNGLFEIANSNCLLC